MGPTRMRLAKPVIAAIEGYAVAGGLELALWCDLRVAAEDAVLGVFCRRWGVPLIDGGTVRLPRLIGTEPGAGPGPDRPRGRRRGGRADRPGRTASSPPARPRAAAEELAAASWRRSPRRACAATGSRCSSRTGSDEADALHGGATAHGVALARGGGRWTAPRRASPAESGRHGAFGPAVTTPARGLGRAPMLAR